MKIYSFLLCGLLVSITGIALADGGEKYVYDHKPTNDITEKPVRVKVVISRFETSLEIPDSPFNPIKTDEKETSAAKDINVKLDDSLAVLAAKEMHEEKYSDADLLVGLLVDKLRKSEFFDVVERQDINELVREINFENGNWVKQDGINKLGNFSGVQYIVLGKLLTNKHRQNVSPNQYLLTLRLCNVNTGEILVASTGQRNSLEGVVEEAVNKMTECIHTSPWTGRIAKIDQGTVLINAGFADNLKKGLTFSVIRIGEDIQDPVTKKVIGSTKQEIARVRIDEVLEANLSRVKVLDQKEGVQVGDIVSARAPNQKIDEFKRWHEISDR